MKMRTTVTIPDELFEELMYAAGSTSRSRAVQLAVEQYVRRAKLEQLRALRGKLEIKSTEALDEADRQEQHERWG